MFLGPRITIDLFFEARISRSLIHLWERVHGKSPTEAEMTRRVINLSSLVLFCSIIPLAGMFYFEWMPFLALLPTIFSCASLLVAIVATIEYFAKEERADRNFLLDCQRLGRLIGRPGDYNEESLRAKAEEILVSLATSSILVEEAEDIGGLVVEDTRTKFREAHTVLSLFGLAQSRWDYYFDKATDKIDETENAVENASPTAIPSPEDPSERVFKPDSESDPNSVCSEGSPSDLEHVAAPLPGEAKFVGPVQP